MQLLKVDSKFEHAIRDLVKLGRLIFLWYNTIWYETQYEAKTFIKERNISARNITI